MQTAWTGTPITGEEQDWGLEFCWPVKGVGKVSHSPKTCARTIGPVVAGRVRSRSRSNDGDRLVLRSGSYNGLKAVFSVQDR